MGETCGCGCRHGTPSETARLLLPSEATVADAAHRSPRGAEILRELGIDTCCGGRLTLTEAAAAAGIPIAAVLEALAADVRTPA